MARVNFEDSVYRNPYFAKLLLKVGNEYTAKGMLLTAWELAHIHWLAHKGIPLDKWPEDLQPLIEFKFARRDERSDGVYIYVSGSEAHCAFIEKQAVNGAKGGRSKSPAKVKNLKQNRSQTEATPKPNRSQKNPTEVSYSNSISNSIIQFPSETGVVAALPPDERNPVALWVKAYKEKYKVRYAFQKKDFGFLKNFGNQYGPDQCEVLFACYLAIKESFYENAKHPLSLFFRDLQKISVAAQTGVDPGQPAKTDYAALLGGK